MPGVFIHLVPFLEIVAALVAMPAVGVYMWRGYRRRQLERLARVDSGQRRI